MTTPLNSHVVHKLPALVVTAVVTATFAGMLSSCAANVSTDETSDAVTAALTQTPSNLWSVSNAGRAVAFSPDGKTLATGSNVDVVQQLSTTDGHQLKTFRIRASVNAVAFSPDGTLLLEGSSTGPLNMRLYRVADGTQVFTEKSAHSNATTAVAFSPTDPTIFATGGRDKQIGTTKIWDTTGTVVHSLNDGHRVFAIAFSPDGLRLVANASGTLHIWRVADGVLLNTLSSVNQSAIAWSPDGRYITTGFELFDANTGALVRTFTWTSGHDIVSATFTKDGSAVVAGGTDNTNGVDSAAIRYFRVADGTVLATFAVPGTSAYIDGVAISPDGKSLAYSVATTNVTALAASPF